MLQGYIFFEKWIFEIEFKCHKIYTYVKVYNLESFFFFLLYS